MERQHGVVTRRQASAHGLTDGAIRCRLRVGHWRRLYPGVYATFTGPVTRMAYLWAVLLWVGPDAVLSHHTAAELVGLIDQPGSTVHVTVPVDRHRTGRRAVQLHRSVRVRQACHPTRLPPQTRVEETVVDLTQAATDAHRAMTWVIRACAGRFTTVDRLRDALAARGKIRWRAELEALLDDVAEGCHSMLELAYLRDVERRHGLPTAQRQVARVRRGGRWYDDVRYTEYCTVVELDGQAAHPAESSGRDALRDNAGVAAGLATLRYGPRDVMARPCDLAVQVGGVLRRNGWRGSLRRCGPDCRVEAA